MTSEMSNAPASRARSAWNRTCKQEVAEFFRQFLGASLFDGVENFIGFFDQVGSEGGVGLLAVPGTAAGGAQAGLDGHQVFEEFADALLVDLRGWLRALQFVGAQTSSRFLARLWRFGLFLRFDRGEARWFVGS